MMSILFYALKSRTLKTGEAPLILRITINGVSDEARIQRSVPICLWNAAKGYFEGKDRTSLELNEYIRFFNLKLLTIHKELMLEEMVITPSLLLKKLFGNEEKQTVLATFLNHNDECGKLIGIDYEKVTINRYDNCICNLAAIKRKFGKENISFCGNV